MAILKTVILNYRTARMALQATESALREMEGIPGGIVLVDNDSGDGSYERMSDEAETRGWTRDGRVQVVQSGRNGGFGAGNNVGIGTALPGGLAPDYTYILNSDAWLEPGALVRLIAHMQANPACGIAGSYICGPEGDQHYTAFRFPTAAGEFEAAARTGVLSRLLRGKVIALPLPQATRSVDWAAGASMILRQDMLDEIGLFDETFFLYFEETDLCLRAARAGWRTDYVRDSVVVHIGSVSTGMGSWKRIPAYWLDSRLHYYVKNHGTTYAAIVTLAQLAGGSVCRLRLLLTGRPPAGPEAFHRDLARHTWRRLTRGHNMPPHLAMARPMIEDKQ
ncbi:MAG: glycosyltransferase family 2 protein [Rhodobacteraceae bacterium]|nr:glycosyltransferase family 2 protein [Paracoccaceae bacterium]